jgi:hypothetical protein
MFDRTLKLIREKVHQCEYVMTIHAEEELDNDGFSIYDVENGILTAKIVERQRDKDTAEWKYRLNGESFSGDEIEVVLKISSIGKLVIITVYEP